MSITRKAFWLALAAAWSARAQAYITEPAWKTGKAINNQCPVCGTMAEPYVYRDAGHLINCDHPRQGLVCVAPSLQMHRRRSNSRNRPCHPERH